MLGQEVFWDRKEKKLKVHLHYIFICYYFFCTLSGIWPFRNKLVEPSGYMVNGGLRSVVPSNVFLKHEELGIWQFSGTSCKTEYIASERFEIKYS